MVRDAYTNFQNLFQRFAMGGKEINRQVFSKLLDEIGYKSFWRTGKVLDYLVFQRILKMADSNENGAIDFYEFYSFMLEKIPSKWKNNVGEVDLSKVREQLLPIVKLLAGDGNQLTYDALYKYLYSQLKNQSWAESKAEVMARLALYAFDSDKNGSISFDEFNDILFNPNSAVYTAKVEDPDKKNSWVFPTVLFGGLVAGISGIAYYGKKKSDQERDGMK